MSLRVARLLPVLLLGACLVAPAAAKTTHHPVRHAASSKAASLIWRGDVTSASAVMDDLSKTWQSAGHGRIELQPFNTASGIDAVAGGSADLAGSARASDGTPENARLTFTPVAWDALVMVTNPANPVRNITLRQLHEIYLGHITNWKDLGGNDAPIDLYAVISPNDGLEYSLRSLLFGRGEQQIAAPRLYLNTKALEEGIALNPNGLGLSSLARVRGNAKLRTIPVDSVAPSAAHVADGSYPLYTPLYVVSNPNSAKATEVKAFLDFLASDKAMAVLRNHAVLPYQDGSALLAKEAARNDTVFAEATASHAKSPLVVPGTSQADASSAAAPAAAAAPTVEQPADPNSYTVLAGDTLESIALDHHVSEAHLRRWNKLKNDQLTPGQTLKLSAH